ncbi:MAG: ATP-sensitive inward rectifier potassium channel 10 [Polyangiaceae bacterium]|nr:ATP-sensitive inward rectifier potassium channel 10 [Polyangiaceae bacterium]
MPAKNRGDLFEIKTIGLKTALHEDVYHRVLRLPWWLFFLEVAIGFGAANALFATLYLFQPGSIAGAEPGSFPHAFYFSVQTMGTIGYGVFSPATHYAHVVASFESLTGLLGFAVVTGLTFAKFARPTARVLFSARAVIGSRDGTRHLMFRMANARHNTIVEASLRVLLLVDVVTKEGERLRVPQLLPLVRDQNPFFRLTWTASHLIDEKSPFYPPGAIESLRERNALLLLTLSGLDDTISQSIHARCSYDLDDVVVGARFADVLKVLPDTTRVIDYNKMDEIVREES